MTEKLLPCPTCGHEPEYAMFLPTRHAVYCHNPKCPVWHRTKYHFTKAEAIAAWNHRFVCHDKNGEEVYAGDMIRTAFRGTVHLAPVMIVMFGGQPNRRLIYSDQIELIQEADNDNH